MFLLIDVKCIGEAHGLVTRYLLTGTLDVEEAKSRALERWDREEKVHVDCKGSIINMEAFSDKITGCWKLTN